MKVLLLNSSDIVGGAAQACNRLFYALLKSGVNVQLWVNEKKGSDTDIRSFNESLTQKSISQFRFAAERISLYPKLFDKKDLFFFSPANTGMDISQHSAIQWADVIHLHWFNHGFLSLRSLDKLSKLGKKIVWTLHDMWAFTGGCHYSRGCESYKIHCGKCPFLSSGQENDLSAQVWNKKHNIYKQSAFSFVTCSNWLAGIASQSSLLKGFHIKPIPNPIDVDIFKPNEKKAAREKLGLPNDKFYILFVSQNLSDERKGFRYLIDALKMIVTKSPELKNIIELIVLGKLKLDLNNLLPMKTHPLGFLSSLDSIVAAYNAADLFILPSLEDNLPNTVMESLSCGVPVVSFNTGGIPEMIDHEKNGVLAAQRSSDELANGILKIINKELPYESLSYNARKKVLDNFTNEKVVEKYMKVYQD